MATLPTAAPFQPEAPDPTDRLRAEPTEAAETLADRQCPEQEAAPEPFTGRVQLRPEGLRLHVQAPAAAEATLQAATGVILPAVAAAVHPAAILPEAAAPAEVTPQVAVAAHPAEAAIPAAAEVPVQADLQPEGNYT